VLLKEALPTGLSAALMGVTALAEIGGAYLVWRGLRDGGGVPLVALGVAFLGAYGILAALQPVGSFGRVLSAYGGVFIVGSVAWATALDGFRPDRFDLVGAAVCLVGAATIVYAPR
jgi:small multidrug resistance family-3 protein